MARKEALISIIVPTYNRAHLIGETIQSVLDQTYGHWELIVVDDGSSDDTWKIVDEFGDERVRYYRIPHSGIIGKVRNTGIGYARGEYIAFLDSDDLWLPLKLEFQLSLLEKYPEASFIFGHGEQFGEGATPTPQLETFFCGNVFLPQLVEERFIFYVPSLLFRIETLDRVKRIDENMVSGGDYDFFLRMALAHKGIFSSERLVKIRKHDQNSTPLTEFISFQDYMRIIERFFREGSLSRKQFVFLASRQYYKQGLITLQNKRPGEAREYFLSHNRLTPFNYKGWLRLIQSLAGSLLNKAAAAP